MTRVFIGGSRHITRLEADVRRLFGEPKTENLVNVSGQINGSTTAYRFWPGKIHFARSITISTEHGNQNDTPANYSSLVYYYYSSP